MPRAKNSVGKVILSIGRRIVNEPVPLVLL